MTGKEEAGSQPPIRQTAPGWPGRGSDAWARELGIPMLELHRSLTSTNGRLRVLAQQGAPPFSTVVADEQTSGRGREGRRWHSPRGGGLWFSVLLSLGSGGTVGVLPLAVGVAVAIAIERWSRGGVGLKWPNDLMIGHRKVGGVLCESAGDSAVVISDSTEHPTRLVAVGIGINLRRQISGLPEDLMGSAGFMEESAGQAVPEPELAREIIAQLRRWAQPLPGSLAGGLRSEWESRDHLQGRRVRLDTGLVGRAVGVSSEGALQVTASDGSTIPVRAGSVRLDEAGVSAALYGVKVPGSSGDGP